MKKFTQKINEDARDYPILGLKDAIQSIIQYTDLHDTFYGNFLDRLESWGIGEEEINNIVKEENPPSYEEMVELLSEMPDLRKHPWVASLYIKEKILPNLPDNMDVFKKLNEE